MLGKFIRKVTGPILFNRPKVAVCVPLGLTGVERRAFEDAAGSAGARSVTLIEAPIAAAIGAGIKIGAPRGSFIHNKMPSAKGRLEALFNQILCLRCRMKVCLLHQIPADFLIFHVLFLFNMAFFLCYIFPQPCHAFSA